MRHASIPLAVFLLLLSAAVAQAGGAPKQKEPSKKEPAKSVETPKSPLTLENLKLTPGSVLVIVDELKDVLSLVPKMILIRPEKLMEMEERIRTLEKLLKQDRRPASVCKLSGKLDGESMQMRAEYFFSTEQPRSLVFLGMQGAFLKDEGELDRAASQLELAEDGLVVRVEKPGSHHLVLNLIVPVGLKRAVLGGSAERSVDLGLPGSTVTTLAVELPAGVKELRWNDISEKRRGARWELALGKAKSLALAWKEPIALPGGGPFLTVDAQITGTIEESQLLWSAELALEDLRGQTKEWHLLLPPTAKVDVKAPGGAAFDLRAVEGKPYTHVLELREAGTERWIVQAQAFQARPEPRTRISMPQFQVPGAYKQQGTIAILATEEAMRGQRLTFHRFGEIHQKDMPRTGNLLATFQYWSHPVAGKMGKTPSRSPLELEWRSERGKVEASLEHEIALHSTARGVKIDLLTRIQFKKDPAGLDHVILQLPRTVAFNGLPSGPNLPFPLGIDWIGLTRDTELLASFQFPEAPLDGEGETLEWTQPDALGRVQVKLKHPGFEPNQIILHGQIGALTDLSRLRVELPRLVDVSCTGTKVLVKAPNELELLQGPARLERPVARVHQFARTSESVLESLDLAWRPYRPQFQARGIADVQIFDRTAHVVMQVQVDIPAAAPHDFDIEHLSSLRHPKGLDRIRVLEGKKPTEAIYEYDVNLQQLDDGNLSLDLPFPWPELATGKELKVRLWPMSGARVRLNRSEASRNAWMDRALERIEEKKSLPTMVLFCPDVREQELNLLIAPGDKSLPSVVLGQGVVSVRVDEEGNQAYRVVYTVEHVYARQLEVEFPLPVLNCLISARLDGVELPREQNSQSGNVAHLRIEPELVQKSAILELTYAIPAASQEGKRGWRSVLHPPRWLGEVRTGAVRWHARFPAGWVAVPLGSQVRQEYRWGWLGWLLAPVPLEGAALAQGPDAELASHGHGSVLVMVNPDCEPMLVLHFSRPLWLLLCSSVILLLGLFFYFLSPSRLKQGALVLLAAAGWISMSWYWPALLPSFVYGCQPGVLVLLFLAALQWLFNQHYQRQVVFLPGFSKLKSNSSLSRASSSVREPSTVDSPNLPGLKKPSTNVGS